MNRPSPVALTLVRHGNAESLCAMVQQRPVFAPEDTRVRIDLEGLPDPSSRKGGLAKAGDPVSRPRPVPGCNAFINSYYRYYECPLAVERRAGADDERNHPEEERRRKSDAGSDSSASSIAPRGNIACDLAGCDNHQCGERHAQE